MLDQAKHRKIMIEILLEIFSNSKISHLLGFKGGTALYLFHNLDRFSVDLDFDLLDRDQVQFVFDELLLILSNFGEIKDQAIKHFGSLIAINYEKGLHRLKIDVSNRQTNDCYEIRHYLGIPIRVMVLSDIAANKLIALTNRKTPAARDVYDIYFILKKYFNFNESIIKERTGLTLLEQLQKTIDYIENNFDLDFLEGLGELVNDEQKSWVKNKMKSETLMKLRIYIDSIKSGL